MSSHTAVAQVPDRALPLSSDPSDAPAEPPLRIETLDAALPSRRRPFTTPLSIGLHAVGLLAVVVVPILSPEEPPPPTTAVRAFFVEPAAIAPPPPPPPPPAPAARAVAKTEPPATSPEKAFSAPVITPESVHPDAGLDLGIEGGVPGGVEGGVRGGVVGGVIGGLPSEAPPPVAPLRVGGKIKEPRKLKHVDPEYPEMAKRARVKGVVILEATVGPDGRVVDATVLRSVPLLDRPALEAVKQWVYTPTLLDGVPVPVVLTVTLTFNLIE